MSAPRGAMAAAHREAPVPTVSWSAMQACRVDGVSACRRAALARSAAGCCLSQVEPCGAWTRRFGMAPCEAQTTDFMHGRQRNGTRQNPSRSQLKQILRGFIVLTRALQIKPLQRWCLHCRCSHFPSQLSSSRAAVAENASLMPKPLPGLAAGPRGMRSSERSGWQRRGCSSWAGGSELLRRSTGAGDGTRLAPARLGSRPPRRWRRGRRSDVGTARGAGATHTRTPRRNA